MTATMTIPLLTALSDLTHVDWTNKKHQLLAKCEDFQQRYNKVSFQVRDHMSCEAFLLFVEYLKEKLNGSAFVFIIFCLEVGKCEEAIEAMFIAAKFEIDLALYTERLINTTNLG